MWKRALTVGIGSAAAWCLAAGLGPITLEYAPRIAAYAAVAPVVLVGVVGAALLPDRLAYRAQTLVILLNWIAWRVFSDKWNVILAQGITIGLCWFILRTAAAMTLRGRRAVVVLATLTMVALLSGEWTWERPVVGILIQAIFIAGSGTLGGNRDESLARAFFAANASRSTPVPAGELQAQDRTIRSVALGGLWVCAALGAYALGTWVQTSEWVDPLRSAAGGRWVDGTAQALVLWIAVIAEVMGTLFVDAGVLRMLGIPVGAPLDRPWVATDFLDYWRRANTWRYRLMVDGYQRLFMPMSGPWMPVGVFLTLMISGVHHAAHARQPFFPFLRWTIEGLICGATAAYRQLRRERDIREWNDSGRVRTPSALSAVVAALIVVIAHGFLMDITRGGKPTETLVRSWFGAFTS